MKKILFTFLIMSFSICLVAQIKEKIDPKTTLPIKGAQDKIPAGSNLDKPVLADFALLKCERHLKYHKIMWKVLLNANPSSNNPLELSREIRQIGFVPVNNAIGHIVVDRRSGMRPVPLVSILNQPSGYNPFPVPVTGTTVLHTFTNGNVSTLSFHWETGNYGNIKEVKEIYTVGTQNFIDVINSQGNSYTIKIFPGYLMDGCQLQKR